MNELTTTKQETTLITSSQAAYTRAQVNIFRDLCAPGASDMELSYFLSIANTLGLDPRLGQIYCVPRWNKMAKKYNYTPSIGVAGYRVLAERTGEYRGSTEPEFCGKDGKWTDNWVSEEMPVKCRVGVLRNGWVVQYAHAYYESRVQRNKENEVTEMWRKDPLGQLAKCAETLALKKAFPTSLGSLKFASMEDLVVEEKNERVVIKNVELPPPPVLPNLSQDRWEFEDIPDCYLPPDLQGKKLSFESLANNEKLVFFTRDKKETKARAVIHHWATGANWPEALKILAQKLLEKFPSKKNKEQVEQQPPKPQQPPVQASEVLEACIPPESVLAGMPEQTEEKQ